MRIGGVSVGLMVEEVMKMLVGLLCLCMVNYLDIILVFVGNCGVLFRLRNMCVIRNCCSVWMKLFVSCVSD